MNRDKIDLTNVKIDMSTRSEKDKKEFIEIVSKNMKDGWVPQDFKITHHSNTSSIKPIFLYTQTMVNYIR